VSLLYLLHRGLLHFWDNIWFSIATATLLLWIFTWFIGLVEKKELSRMPYISRFYKAPVDAPVASEV
jgi:hypothetical protein